METVSSRASAVLANLEAARALLAEHFTTGQFAKTIDGDKCSPLAPEAACFCSIGALYKVTNTDINRMLPFSIVGYHELVDAAQALNSEGVTRHTSVVGVNDADGKAAALLMFDRAIQKARGGAQEKTK